MTGTPGDTSLKGVCALPATATRSLELRCEGGAPGGLAVSTPGPSQH